ncbi:condensation domain-containing protein [Streptomyces sp. NBC_00932]|uniref:condensation domain-containing protein n=1 Tax=Streptomyces sp. NBC_00932 TaxID=2903690 RepID=UPI00386E28F8|nr:condensation domain-containing protein [Streptomyces sp. NBC_00932]
MTPADGAHVAGDGPAPSRSAVEEGIGGIFRDILRRDDVGVLDDFFDLGGSSLMAVRALGQIHERYGVRVRAMDFFESPAVATLAQHVMDAAPAQWPQVSRRPAGADPVLSYDQQRLWLEDQLLPSAAYHVHGRQRLSGVLDLAALDASLRAIMDRHEALRSRFPVQDGRTIQIVDALADDWHLRFEDVRAEPDGEARARELMDADAAAPFSLETGPLVRCLVIRVGEAEHALSITAHHIVCDDWSVGVFVKEVSDLYAAGGDPERADLPRLEVQYRDFAVWQRRWLTGEYLRRQVDYWREHLAGAPAALALPSRRRGTPDDVPTGGRVSAALSAADTRALGELCRKADATAFMALLAGFGTVLSRCSGQEDVVIGVPITGRSDARLQNLIGFFVNTLPFRLDLSGDPTFAEVLARARKAALGGYAHAEAPLDLLVGELPATRVPSRTPLFQVILNGVDTPEVHPLAGTTGEVLDTPTRPSKFELTLSAREWDGVLRFDLEFDANRYERDMIEQLLDQLMAVLRTATRAPDRPLGEYRSAAPGEPSLTLVPGPTEDPTTTDSAPPRGPLPAAEPDAVAVVDRDGEWTYRRIDAAADDVAQALTRHLPVHAPERRPDDADRHVVLEWRPTALCAAALLGSLRAGVQVTLDRSGDARRVSDGLTVRADGSGITLRRGADETCVIDPGKPPNGGTEPGTDTVVPGSRPDWAVARYGFGAHDRFAVLSGSTHHVISALLTAFAAGGTVVLVDHSPAVGARALAAELAEAGVSVLYAAPPVLRTLAGFSLPALRHVLVENAGSFVPQDVVAVRRTAPEARCTGLYGVGPDGRPAALHDIPDEWAVDTAPLRVPLGQPAHGTVRLVRRGGQEAAVGEVAELRVGDSWNGEFGRRWADGTLEFVAMAGNDPSTDPLQVTCALRELPGVVDALVVDAAPAGAGTGFVAYVVTDDGEFDLAAAQPRLAARLPDTLLPQHLVVVEGLPLTADGEYDLAALPRPESSETADRYVAPRTPLERQLVDILAALLEVDRVGIHDSFFELGGFSLLATQLNIQIRDTVRVDLTLRDIFASSTVEMLAQRIAFRQAEQEPAEDVEALLSDLESEASRRA